MKYYFIHVNRIITDVFTTKGNNTLLFVKGRIRICSFVSLLMLYKFKVLCLSEISIWQVTILDTIKYVIDWSRKGKC